MLKREARASIESQKHQMIAALYANSAFDESKDGTKARAEQIKQIEKHFNRAIELVYNPDLPSSDEKEIDWENPFWAAAKRAQQKRQEIVSASLGNSTVQQVLDMDEEQIRAREESRRQIDQL